MIKLNKANRYGLCGLLLLLLAGCAQPTQSPRATLYDCWDASARELSACSDAACRSQSVGNAKNCAAKAQPDQAFCAQVPATVALQQEVLALSCKPYLEAFSECQQALRHIAGACSR
ncbi:hypothetical protein [Thiopseudomonas alkaliphila]|uniref:Lipoprotein n=1 Tax=Thiopseudomonas alkaliphila TaxID=1697053 RepID=A0A0K1XB87_9GAMM|nr:hypothetical protein [Thiopseudomonas alkaliphila]AKX54296.1 hypothetical protein AKN90_00055 [Thiopseudomonas alkaliphila]AKX58514.1 hypothetical protein AKN88_00055 [Thiopseudomonas alkaliphila]MDM1717289.1 hypothetical protein [Thiopseudomonas alkaliphila]